jgi:fructokinase
LPIDLFASAEILVLGTLVLANHDSGEAVKRALQLAEQHYLRVVVDINWRPLFWEHPDVAPALIFNLLEYADFLKLSTAEAQWLFNTTDPATISDKLDHLEAILITDGENGCHYMIGDRQGHCPGFKVNPVVDTTGAGDAFVAGFIHQLCQHKLSDLANPEISDRMVRYACAVGAIVTQNMGAMSNLPSDAQVQEFIASSH